MTASVGSKYYAIDFHVHTTASEDYKQKDATPLDIVNAALSANLDAIVITDHNTINGIDTVRDAAKDTNLTVFPGFEVNTKGGHVLGVFDPNTKI
jgi:predicted metal-dependent phosphoesterase TrpH